ncbi:hypothetical protein [Mycolicibacterium grossiae]|uniref:Uncharacterized protein n=1 Tax=Mycolicibacterium grossiae TaxID=1552759 RepID=A0A1E8QAZ0_9MYCO|nr:hypothetical protein [Mycolicibacterium grossiae]OFJ55184.1 hypothetical protein BEL07_03145 [Mycolicibacterium grossiae]QEM46101.1 hypothetical protein FZ046_16210 [Mycolicibacterium grossiae]
MTAADMLIEDGDGWLAAYDLFVDGDRDRWLTAANYREAHRLAREKAFWKFSGSVERRSQANRL